MTTETYTEGLARRLMKWAVAFFRVGSNDAGALLKRAAETIDRGEKDPELAAELQVCASMRDHLPEQSGAASLMREASDWLLS